MRWVRSDDLTSDEPIEEHAHGRQVLFDRWLGVILELMTRSGWSGPKSAGERRGG
jgi:hypothetical protein